MRAGKEARPWGRCLGPTDYIWPRMQRLHNIDLEVARSNICC